MAWCLTIVLWWKGHTKYLALCILLGCTLGIELAAEWLIHAGKDFVWMYHCFVILEYALLSIYFAVISKSSNRKYILSSIPVFALSSLAVSWKLYRFHHFPGLNINMEGLLMSVICTGVLFNLDAGKDRRISRHPDFWIATGLLIFFSGTFFSNGVYTYLLAMSREQALALFSMVNKPLNVILYGCLITGCLCAVSRRSSTRLF